MAPTPHGQDQNDGSDLDPRSRPKSRCGIVKDGAEGKNGEPQRREVVMQEELSLHEEERKVMQRPADDEERADFVVIRNLG